MPKILFLSRAALICNICFLITLLMHYIPAIASGIFSSTLIILGTVMAIVINVLMNILYLIIVFYGRPIRKFVPVWLISVNFLFLILQVILLIK